MIRHILRKDFRLFWPLAALVGVFHFIYAVLLFMHLLWLFEDGGGGTDTLLEGAIILGGAFLIAAIVHADALPGVRQDWLVRPIERWQLLVAKFLSIVLLAHVPLLLADLFYGLLSGNPIGTSLQAALSRNVLALVIVTLPLLALSSLTKAYASHCTSLAAIVVN